MDKVDNFKKNEHINKLKKILKKGNNSSKDRESKDIEIDLSSTENELINKLNEKNKKLNEEIDELKRKMLVTLADKENLQKSMMKDIENARNYGINRFAEQIVNSLDALEESRKNINTGNHNNSQLIENILDGINMTAKNIENVLKNHNITKVNPLGEKFDHHYHQAVKVIQGEANEKGLVKEVLQYGYTIKDRVLRPAMVIVAE